MTMETLYNSVAQMSTSVSFDKNQKKKKKTYDKQPRLFKINKNDEC